MNFFKQKVFLGFLVAALMLACTVFIPISVSAETEGDFEYTVIFGEAMIEKYLGNDSE